LNGDFGHLVMKLVKHYIGR